MHMAGGCCDCMAVTECGHSIFHESLGGGCCSVAAYVVAACCAAACCYSASPVLMACLPAAGVQRARAGPPLQVAGRPLVAPGHCRLHSSGLRREAQLCADLRACTSSWLVLCIPRGSSGAVTADRGQRKEDSLLPAAGSRFDVATGSTVSARVPMPPAELSHIDTVVSECQYVFSRS